MKTTRTKLWASALLAIGLWNQTKPIFAQGSIDHNTIDHNNAAHSKPPYTTAQTLWKDVQDNSSYLDGLVTQKKLGEVHEAAFNLRDSVRLLRSASTALSAASNAALDKNILQIDALASAMDETGDKNDLKGTVANQRKIHLALDRIAALYPTGTLTPIGPVVARGPVKDPVCRMTVDPTTAPAKVAFGGQTYYFCSQGDATAFSKAPAEYAALYEDITFGPPKTFAVSLTTDGQAHAGHPQLLTFAVREKGKTALVRDFQLVHEKLMHLIVVSDDLSYFSHEHPQIGKDGRFRLNWTFPRAGRYFLFSDFTPGDGLNQILRTQITVDGAKPKALPKLVPDRSLSKVVDGYTFTVTPSAPLEAGKSTLLTYSITRGGQPVKDMDLYLGANGHLMAINQNGRDIVHTHTVAAGGAVTHAMATPHGPNFTYDVTLPVGGLTKIWTQFRRGQHILTVAFTFNVAGTRAMTPKTALPGALMPGAPMPGRGNDANGTKGDHHDNQGMQMGAGMHMGAMDGGSVAGSATKSGGAAEANVQNVTIILPQDYQAEAATVKAGIPIALTFFLKSEAGCGDTVTVPAANWSKSLHVGERATLIFTPKASGPLAFQCEMGMYKGTLTVK